MTPRANCTVPTPLDSYNPDWALLVEQDGSERLYFVVETKSGLFTNDLRDKERSKIECGKAHFEALAVRDAPVRYIIVRGWMTCWQQREGVPNRGVVLLRGKAWRAV